MSDYKVKTDAELDKMDLDELKKERSIIQDFRLKSKTYLHAITLRINGILQENEALKKLTPETAEALDMPPDKVALVKEYQDKRKKALAEGKDDVVIRHRHTLTMTPSGVKRKKEEA